MGTSGVEGVHKSVFTQVKPRDWLRGGLVLVQFCLAGLIMWVACAEVQVL